MIKINFLHSYRDFANAQGLESVAVYDGDERQQLIVASVKRLAVLLIGPVALYGYELHNLPILTTQKEELAAKLNEVTVFNNSKQGLAEEIQRYQEEQTRFNAQMDFINKIQADKLNEYQLFNMLKKSTPPKVWIKMLNVAANNQIDITGESIDPDSITRFTDALAASDFIENLTPVNQTTQNNIFNSGLNSTMFVLKAKLNIKPQTNPTNPEDAVLGSPVGEKPPEKPTP